MDFIWLVFAHYFGDIAFQPSFIADGKRTKWYLMLCHVMLWTGTISIALEYLGLLELWKVAFLFIGHWAMDDWKCQYPKEDKHWWRIYPDQAWHLIQCAIVYFV